MKRKRVRILRRLLSNHFIYWRSIVFIPLLFAYGKYVGDQNYMDRAISWLESLKAENNSVSRRYKRYGLTLCNALETQAVFAHAFNLLRS
ncbi:DUF2851 family protein [Sphingobacterium daejeonense]|uniref:DUF2851 family protein n=1 Tax=Sphingobacterium daejeonense TaxID=371142 RepID=UPI0037446E03